MWVMARANGDGDRGVPRRDFLRLVGAGSAALFFHDLWSAPALGRPVELAIGKGKTAKRCLVLWMAGGPSQFETFDPKPGMPTGGPFRKIPTAVDGVEIAELLPGVAARFQDLCLIRSMTSKEGSHARARYLVHTGYSPNPTVRHPSLGAIVAEELGPKDFELPNFVQIGGGGGGPLGGGYLGVHASPFVVADPRQPIANLSYARGVDGARLDGREQLLGTLEEGFAKRGGAEPVAANRALIDKARRMMDSKKASAFRLDGEEKALARYGDNAFGAACLAARKLLETGVTSVEVVLDGWDTHDNNHERVKKLCQILDPAMSALLDDLKHGGLLSETLVVWMGEFGRTPQITPSNGRGHFTKAWCALLAGGGVRGGQAIGATDERGEQVTGHPIPIPDLFATFAELFGIDGSQIHYAGKRPIWLVDQSGKPVPDILAGA
jgi:hypothetical protein